MNKPAFVFDGRLLVQQSLSFLNLLNDLQAQAQQGSLPTDQRLQWQARLPLLSLEFTQQR
jgi:hypothetical protein